MGIGTDLIRFFERTNGHRVLDDYRPRSLKEFIKEHPEHDNWNLNSATQKLVHQGYLIELDDEGIFLEAHSWHNRCYFSQLDVEEELIYGTFDFFVLGFPYIRTYFAPAVKAVYVIEKDGRQKIGSGFVLEDHRFVTAFHCIKEMSDVEIDGWVKADAPLQRIGVPTDEKIDLCVLEFKGDPFPGVSGFRLQEAHILDEVMTLGYPNISLVEPTLVAERTQVAGRLQATCGAVVGQMTDYWQQPYWLLSTLIKGGNSGGPVVGIEGKVVGVITYIPTNLTGEQLLGYGGAIPTATLRKLLQACKDKSEYVQYAAKQDTETGFKHVRRLS